MPDRRRFLKTASSAALFPAFAPSLSMAKSANGKLCHACVGTDGMGASDLENLASHDKLEIVALCDVDTSRMAKARKAHPQARVYQDWREMLEKEGDRIDSINVTIPDHMHASVAMEALRRGKHVYCQKPLTHDVAEARALRLAAAKAGVVTQMGNQIQSAIEYQMAVRMLQDGVIGKVKEIHAWSGAQFPEKGRPQGNDPIPKTLDWNMWLGSAPERPFKHGVYHPFNWRGWQDFGGGAMGDFGCHILDTPFKALGLTAPSTVQALKVDPAWEADSGQRQENWPTWEIIKFVFPGNGRTIKKTIDVTWYDGSAKPPRELFDFENKSRDVPGGGSLFIGEGGKFLVPHVAGPQLLPYKLNRGLKRPDVKGFSHYHAFVDACHGKGKTGSHFNFAGPLAETTCLGMIASRFVGQELKWDVDKMAFTNVAEANPFLRRTYREEWKVEGL